ncbi:MAG: SDR family oxidoreductase [Deltaproteobacteria bacterium]|nr:SDR family oxidoreductase [Deltaproteobacteria bacterium]
MSHRKKRRVLVTGATDGIGKETAAELARRGHQVILHGRTRERAEAVAAEIKGRHPEVHLDTAVADLSSQRQIVALAADLESRFDGLDVLLNNAGVFMTERQLTEDGLERTFAVNHVAPMMLSLRLERLLAARRPGRVITVSSIAHQRGTIAWDNLQGERSFDGYQAYALSKLGNLLFAFELAARRSPEVLTSNALHPGVVSTKLLRTGFGMGGADLASGAATSVHLADSIDVEASTGLYYVDCRAVLSSAASRNPELRRRLWEVTEGLMRA